MAFNSAPWLILLHQFSLRLHKSRMHTYVKTSNENGPAMARPARSVPAPMHNQHQFNKGKLTMWKEEDKSTKVDHCQLDEDASAPESSFSVQMYLCSA